MYRLKKEAVKFTIVGALNFVLTLAVFTAALKVFHVNYLLSLVTAWAVGLIFSYSLNFSWVFASERKIEYKKNFPKYFLANLVSIGTNMSVLHYIVAHTGFDPFDVQMALIPCIVIFNFCTAKYWAFNTNLAQKT